MEHFPQFGSNFWNKKLIGSS